MKSFSFSLTTLIVILLAIAHSASAQWTGVNPTYLAPLTAKAGIGTMTPTQKLQIAGGNVLLDYTDVPATTGNLFFGGVTYPANQNGMRLSYYKGSNNGYIDVRTSAATEGIIFRADIGTTPGTERMRICANGNVGIGAIPGAYRLHVNGNTNVTGTLSVASDQRFKKEVQTLNDALATVGRLRGVQYEYNQHEFADRNFPNGKTDGFIAQEVRDVLPELVNEGSDGYLSVNYLGLIPVLTEAVKELKTETDKQITDLESRLSAKERQIIELETRLAKMEQHILTASNGKDSSAVNRLSDGK